MVCTKQCRKVFRIYILRVLVWLFRLYINMYLFVDPDDMATTSGWSTSLSQSSTAKHRRLQTVSQRAKGGGRFFLVHFFINVFKHISELKNAVFML